MKLYTHIHEWERGLLFQSGDFVKILPPGRYGPLTLGLRARVDKVSVRLPQLMHPDLEVIIRKTAEHPDLRVLNVSDTEGALVWSDGRFQAILGPGLHAFWTAFHEITSEIVDASGLRLQHPKLKPILAWSGANHYLEQHTVPMGHLGLLHVDGELREELAPGLHVFWKGVAAIKVQLIDRRESVLEISGQEIMTADKVSLRLNALVTWSVRNARTAVEASSDHQQAIYRSAQMVIRESIGARQLDDLLADKDVVAAELHDRLVARMQDFGVEIRAIGIRDIILPGEMKVLFNKVTEARKAAEAALITRREETASMRSQANTARILEDNPTLMRMRELEVLEKVAATANLSVVLGDSGLTQRITHLM